MAGMRCSVSAVGLWLKEGQWALVRGGDLRGRSLGEPGAPAQGVLA